jgi:hypothetical protein
MARDQLAHGVAVDDVGLDEGDPPRIHQRREA